MAVTAPSSTTLAFRFSTISVQSFLLHSCLLGAYAFNTGDTSYTLRSANFVSGTFNNFGGSAYSDSKIKTGNTLLGTQSYHITNQIAYQYALTISNGQVSSSTNVSVSYSQYAYLVLTFAKCNGGNPFLSMVDNTCYGTCPIRTSTNSYYSECRGCPTYDCEYCNDTTKLCTQCLATDNR